MNKEAKLGLFVLIVFMVFLFFTINMGSLFFTRGELVYRVFFHDIGTLEVGAPVKQAGYDVGEVNKISRQTIYEPTSSTFIVVDIQVSNDSLISSDSKASILTLGMMGEKYIEITFGSGERAPSGTRIEGQGPVEISRVMEKASQLADTAQQTIQSFNAIIGNASFQTDMTQLIANFKRFSEELNSIIGGEEHNFQKIVANLIVASDNLKSMIATAELFITDARAMLGKNDKNIAKTLENTAAISQDVRENLVKDLKEMSGNLKSVSAQLNDAVARADRMMDKIDNVIDENRPDVKKVMSNVTELSARAGRATQRVDEILEHIQKQDGLVHNLIYDKEMAVAAKESIREASGLLKNVSSFQDRFSFEVELLYYTDTQLADPDQNHLRADLGVRFGFTDEISLFLGGNFLGSANQLEAQFGYRWGALIFHGGIVESKVAAGVDWKMFDRLLLGLEGVGLTNRNQDRLDAFLEYRLWKNVYLKGGVQDLTDDVFPNVGLKIRF